MDAKRTSMNPFSLGFNFVKGQIRAYFGKLCDWTCPWLCETGDRMTNSPLVIQKRLHTEEVTFEQLQLGTAII